MFVTCIEKLRESRAQVCSDLCSKPSLCEDVQDYIKSDSNINIKNGMCLSEKYKFPKPTRANMCRGAFDKSVELSCHFIGLQTSEEGRYVHILDNAENEDAEVFSDL
jgi:hypothetical protein